MDMKAIEEALGKRDTALAGRLGNIEKLLEDHAKKWDAREDAESRSTSPGKTRAAETEDREHMKVFSEWVRKPRNDETRRKLTEFEMNRKAVSIGTPASGGYAVPEEIGREIEKQQMKLSPVRRLVRVERRSTSDLKEVLDLGGAEGGWSSETGTRNETSTPTLREITPTGGELYAYPKTTEWALDDVFFDVKKWLVDGVSERFAQLEGIAVISGDGSNKPTGMLNTTPVTTADDAVSPRAAAAFQYVLGADNSPATVDMDALKDLVYTLNGGYRSGAAWAMNSTTAGQISKLKTSDMQYLWQPSNQVGQPPMLLGYPVEIWEQMPDPLGGAFPIAFGNFEKAYRLFDRSELRITVDNVTSAGWIKFYVRRRVYGHVYDNNAVKFLKLL